jgi:hypothetical protein
MKQDKDKIYMYFTLSGDQRTSDRDIFIFCLTESVYLKIAKATLKMALPIKVNLLH